MERGDKMTSSNMGGSNNLKFNGYKMEFELEAQMPIIHFQARQQGATLRATEVKPKLDRYLIDRCREEDMELKKEDLDYKMQIMLKKPGDVVLLENKYKENNNWKIDRTKTFSIFYGNMNVDEEDKKYGVFSNPTVTIICFKEKIKKLLEKHILNFFLTTNFGTMQRKGFGSFIPVGWYKNEMTRDDMKKVANAFRIVTGGDCYAMTFNRKSDESDVSFCVRMSEEIKQFYSIMKSGRNYGGYIRSYIYQYGHKELSLGNEKYWMKKNGITPIVGEQEKWKYATEHEQRYLRAFLGMGDKIEYGTEDENGKFSKKKTVAVSIKSNSLERCETPIYFKVIRNVVFIAAYPVPEELYGKSFTFSSVEKNDKGVIPNTEKSGKLSVPTKAELPSQKGFDIQSFLKSYVNYYNNEVQARNKTRVVEVKTNE